MEFQSVLPPRADEPTLLGAEVKLQLAKWVPQVSPTLLAYLS